MPLWELPRLPQTHDAPLRPVSASTIPSISTLMCLPLGRASTLGKGCLGWKKTWLSSSSHWSDALNSPLIQSASSLLKLDRTTDAAIDHWLTLIRAFEGSMPETALSLSNVAIWQNEDLGIKYLFERLFSG